MTDTGKLIAIAQRLLVGTQQGRIKWEETASEYKFQTSFEDYSIVVLYSGIHGHGINIINKNGRTIQNLFLPTSKPEHKIIISLYNIARRQALRVDEALDGILNRLPPIEE